MAPPQVPVPPSRNPVIIAFFCSSERVHMSLYAAIRKVFRLMPQRIQGYVAAAVGKRRVGRMVEKLKTHDAIYDADYFAFIDRTALQSAPTVADSIIETFDPDSVLDVGCGTGALLHELNERSLAVAGLEYSREALKYCQRRSLEVVQFDLESDGDPFPGRRFDLVISVEVAEHLPATVADNFVDLICRYGNCVVFTAATPGQGGRDHVNEQPNQYWIEKFNDRGFQFLEDQTVRWRNTWKSKEVAPWYSQNLMLFATESSSTFK